MSDEQPEAEPEATEAEAPEGAAPPLATDPILGDVRTDVVTIGPGNERTTSEPAVEEEAEGEAEAEA
jgi:hypothetical protein